MKDKVTDISTRSKVKNALHEIAEYAALELEIAKYKSKYQKQRYDCLKELGFAHNDIIEIIKNEKTPYDS